jgi:hypothetical protein
MRDPHKYWIVTDFDRLNGGLAASREEAERKAAEMATSYPGNTIHVLESVCAFERIGDAVEREDNLSDLPE